jgi:hypothetical protein
MQHSVGRIILIGLSRNGQFFAACVIPLAFDATLLFIGGQLLSGKNGSIELVQAII